MIIDAHCHAWPQWPYARAAGAAPIDPARHGSAERLLEAMSRNGVDRALVVSAGIGDPAQDDDDYLRTITASDSRLSYVADVDSRWSTTYHDGRMASRIASLADEPALIGVGHYLADDADDWWGSSEATHVAAALADRNLLLSLHAPPTWHAALGGWAARHPRVRIILHHLGLVRSPSELTGLLALADLPNILVKASGFAYLAPDEAPEYPTARRVMTQVVRRFGADRVAWGSDFPVSPERGIDYPDALRLAEDGLRGLGAAERAAVLSGTAARLLDRRSS